MQSLDNRVTNLHLLEQPMPLSRDPDDGLDVATHQSPDQPSPHHRIAAFCSNFQARLTDGLIEALPVRRCVFLERKSKACLAMIRCRHMLTRAKITKYFDTAGTYANRQLYRDFRQA